MKYFAVHLHFQKHIQFLNVLDGTAQPTLFLTMRSRNHPVGADPVASEPLLIENIKRVYSNCHMFAQFSRWDEEGEETDSS